jgi:hypothetical protein
VYSFIVKIMQWGLVSKDAFVEINAMHIGWWRDEGHMRQRLVSEEKKIIPCLLKPMQCRLVVGEKRAACP